MTTIKQPGRLFSDLMPDLQTARLAKAARALRRCGVLPPDVARLVEQRAMAVRELIEAQEIGTALTVLEAVVQALPEVSDSTARAVLERRTSAVSKALRPLPVVTR